MSNALFGLVLFLSCASIAQEFRNLNFEEAVTPPQSTDPSFEDLFPGWQSIIPTNDWAPAYYDSVMDSPLCYTLSDTAVDYPGWAEAVVLSGRHSIIMVVSGLKKANTLGIRQTGLIPAAARTIRFQATPRSLMAHLPNRWGVTLLMNGETVPTALMELSETNAAWNGDVSKFSGQITDLELRVWLDPTRKPALTYPNYVAVALDEIEFSSELLTTLPSATGANVVAWGDLVNAVPIPAGATNLVMISPGVFHAAALETQGQVFTWGEPASIAPPPLGMSNAVAAAAGLASTYAVAPDGRVFVWPATTNLVPGITNAVGISANATFALILKADGTVIPLGTMNRYFWGFSPETIVPAYVPAGLSNVVAVAAGGLHGLALRSDGTALPWTRYLGPDNSPEGSRSNSMQTNVPPAATNIVAIAAGAFHSLALRADGLVFSWGENDYGQTNVPPGLSNVVAIAAGNYHNVALRDDGTIVAWGDNVYGQTNVPSGLTNVLAIAAGGDQAIALLRSAGLDPRVPITSWHMNANGFTVSVPTQSGRVYRLEYSDQLNPPQWSALPLVSGTGGVRTLLDPNPASTARFYRVGRW